MSPVRGQPLDALMPHALMPSSLLQEESYPPEETASVTGPLVPIGVNPLVLYLRFDAVALRTQVKHRISPDSENQTRSSPV
jgi:hypothetical protein